MDRALAKVDLNLLRVLHLLLEERSVTRAAERLFISQPAMSKSLHRLRILLDDPLFVRSAQGLQPTPRAEELAAPLQAAFQHLEKYLTPSSFNPATAIGTVRIAAPEQFALGTLPSLLSYVLAEAPNLAIMSLHIMDNYLELLTNGQLDFAINLDKPYPDHFVVNHLLSAVPMIWFRKHHPLAEHVQISLADMFSYPMITFQTGNVTARHLRFIESKLSEAGLRYHVILDTSHLLVAIDTLLKTDAVMLAPDYLARTSALSQEIVQRPATHIPAFDNLRIRMSLVQHEKSLSSPLHRWIVARMSNAQDGEFL